MKNQICTILGGGGFIGRYLVRNLTKKNYRCIITTRNTFQKGSVSNCFALPLTLRIFKELASSVVSAASNKWFAARHLSYSEMLGSANRTHVVNGGFLNGSIRRCFIPPTRANTVSCASCFQGPGHVENLPNFISRTPQSADGCNRLSSSARIEAGGDRTSSQRSKTSEASVPYGDVCAYFKK